MGRRSRRPKGDFRVRQWRFQGETNRKVTKYYRDSTAGDSPELMPLDSSLFNDLIEAVHRAVCSTSHRKMDGSDGFKFYFGTPAQAWGTMYKCWNHAGQGAVSSKRIMEDIDRVKHALITIIEHSGTVVPDLDNRKGHRKEASRLELGGKLIPEAAAALDEQLKTFEGLSGPAL